ncbi:MAG: HAD-IIIA family hydrolase [Candidatus Cloacimonetes bacterium]|nr:HAD-IIIA family hydrolase [Candidatus Cloacimonadota bacterium]
MEIYILKPALFLDLDDTIRYSKSGGFVSSPEDIALFEDVEEIIWNYKNEGFLICGITNQGGVAFGHKTIADNEAELQQTRSLFDHDPFDMIMSCYSMPGGKVQPYNHRSLLRKPDIGMLVQCELQAFQEGIIIDWTKSIMVGDRDTDELCAGNAGIPFYWADSFFFR